MPIVVGGEAVEIYSQGSYTTGDIDIKAPYDIMAGVLDSFGFERLGGKRTWLNREIGIGIDWLGSSLDEGEEAERRTNTIVVDGLPVRVISAEDLVVDRLSASRFWGDEDSALWAEALMVITKESIGFDVDYAAKQATRAGVREVFDKLLIKVSPLLDCDDGGPAPCK